MMTVVALVVFALAAGTLVANWPFWKRAWQWHVAPEGWPEHLAGPTVRIAAGDGFLPLRVVRDANPDRNEAGANRATPNLATEILLVGDISGQVAASFGEGHGTGSVIDGRGLAAVLPAMVLAVAAPDTSVLDVPLRSHLAFPEGDPRGSITPRQLLWHLSGLRDGPFVPLNPWSSRAQLASGPDFDRAAMQARLRYPPGAHFEEAPANTQLVSMLVARLSGVSYARSLENLWSRFAQVEAAGLLDHRRGQMAAHCCIRAAAMDWLRMGLLVAAGGKVGEIPVLPGGHLAQMTVGSPVHPSQGFGFRLGGEGAGRQLLIVETQGRRLSIAPHTGRSVLWVGAGTPPEWLDDLLLPENFTLDASRGDSEAGE